MVFLNLKNLRIVATIFLNHLEINHANPHLISSGTLLSIEPDLISSINSWCLLVSAGFAFSFRFDA